ncbi:hypothetical protein BH23ACT12_BH23ACT12_15180 [soil metagenome]
MTAAVVGAPAAAARTPGELERWMRVLALVILPIGPAAVAIIRFVLPYLTVDEPAEMASAVSANLGAQSAVLWLGFVAVMTLTPAVIWIGRMTYRGAPKLTVAALALAIPGYLALGMAMATDLILYAAANNGLDQQVVTGLVSNPHPVTAVVEIVFVLGHLVGTVLLGVALWRTRSVPVWAAVLTTFSQPLHLVAAVVLASRPLDLVAWMMTAVGFAAAGAASARRTI